MACWGTGAGSLYYMAVRYIRPKLLTVANLLSYTYGQEKPVKDDCHGGLLNYLVSLLAVYS